MRSKSRIFGLFLMSVALLLLSAGTALAKTEVVATTSAMGMLARTVGGEAVRVTVLAPPDRDAHYLQARPSMMVALRRADLVVAVGAELEVGWLPPALQGAANPRVLPGRSGYFEAAAQVPLIEVGAAADRALGDVHPAGNPHVNMDPVRMAEVARALAGRLGQMQPAAAATFQSNAEAFARQVQERLPHWQANVQGAPGVVLFHKDANYLMELLEVPVLGYIEPLPGIPPTARHLESLVSEMRERRGVVLYINHQPAQGPQFVARTLGWPVQALPLDPPLDADAGQYLALIDQWVEAIARGKNQ
ncbi:zinc/manganese transport system substrate-binding protein [Geoalkalibacter ferrihydriticus]|uniref:ABC transporter substrate-binding protein n=2 Tax=Geoalkalibacter ferrihydriticus TaxID=392333 RepID=A0A0C2HLR0_9BACT|nr:metal ABC transporter substrate-binding protein [Geoalkalibacter ferrihydriticus]KIH75930.1 ABC transporter substrate-binding protein [Geoalkalibacter ferrihydriticus DSM 17813]SDM55846.1 zinc/manganese transport system substrate-binding protein [Geoalkalibacter ferrihydriticus]